MYLDRAARVPDTLLSDISNVLKTLPGARTLYAFGSLMDERRDTYSDIDLKLVTDDLDLSLTSRLDVLSQVKPVALEWVIDTTSDSWAATILFADTSPYHKLDIDISVADRFSQPASAGLVRLWESGSGEINPPLQLSSKLPYMPVSGTVEHFVLGQILGATRYVKARRHGNAFTCWRFASALIDATHSLLYMHAFPGELIDRKLTTSEYLRLDNVVEPATRDRFAQRLDLSSAKDMDMAVHNAISEAFTLSDMLSDQSPIPASLVTQFMKFFNAELL